MKKNELVGYVDINGCQITIIYAEKPIDGIMERICSILTDSYYERLERKPEDIQSDGFF